MTQNATNLSKPTPGPSARGLVCDENGVRLGGCSLVTRDKDDHQTFYRLRSLGDLGGLLSAAYGATTDADRHHATLQRVAGLMSAGRLGLAQIAAIQMRLPDLPAVH